MAERDQEFLEFVVKGLVEFPDDVKINRSVDEMGVLLTLDLHGDDMGKVIGRSGNTAKAIRTLLRVVGMKHNARVNLKINEPAGSTRGTAAANGATNTEEGAPTSWAGSGEQSPVMKSVDQAMEDLGNF